MINFFPISGIFTAQRANDYPSFVVDNTERTWGDLRNSVYCLLEYLSEKEESRWLLNCEALYDFAVGFFALLAAGKTVIIPPNFLAGTLRELAHHYDAVLGPVICSDPGTLNTINQPESFGPEISRNSEVQLFTSGTTGEPKKIVKKLAQLEDEIFVLERFFGEKCGDAYVFGSVPHQHIYGLLFRFLWPLAAGRCIVSRPTTSPADFDTINLRSDRSVLVSSPAFLSRLYDLVDLSTYRGNLVSVFSSGGPLPEEDARVIKEFLNQAPIEVFGSTETGGVAWRRFGESEDPTLWSSLPGVDVSKNDAGALTVESPFTGGTKMAMGDGVEIFPKGCFRLGPRLDRIVKIQEKRVSLAEVERALREYTKVEDAIVVYLPGERSSLGAVVVLSELEDLSDRVKRLEMIDQFKEHLATRFEPAALPRKWRFIESLPYDDRGKLVESNLIKLFKNKPDIQGEQD